MSEETKDQKIPIEWRIPEYTFSRYATNLVVQRTEHEYVLSFFEIHPPIILEETQETLESIPAECVARIIVSANKMPAFVEALQQNLLRTSKPESESEQ